MPPPETARLIRHGRLEDDRARLFEAPDVLPPDEAGWMVPLAQWRAAHRALRARHHPVAVLLAPDDDCEDFVVAGENTLLTGGIAFVAIDFPRYVDGRGYSLAQLLRHPYGWQGELRAVGDVLIDTLHYLARCGFDSFVLKPGHDPARAQAALNAFSAHYQRAYRAPAAHGSGPGEGVE